MKLHSQLSQKNIVLVDSIKENVTPLLDQPAHRHFSDHSVTHSERIIEVISTLLEG